MQRLTRILMVVFVLAVFLTPNTASAFFGATATIVDEETGEPIEGAIALAQWVKYSATLFEGGVPYAAKAKETTSDKDGKIYISGYWTLNPFASDRHLTVYKPGYALWNSDKDIIPVKDPPPKGFNRFTRVVRLVKFEKAAEEWKRIAYTEFERQRPRDVNTRFLSMCLETNLDTNSITLDEVFERYEGPLRREENVKAWREHEKSKNK
jgi:hypothetical protein